MAVVIYRVWFVEARMRPDHHPGDDASRVMSHVTCGPAPDWLGEEGGKLSMDDKCHTIAITVQNIVQRNPDSESSLQELQVSTMQCNLYVSA